MIKKIAEISSRNGQVMERRNVLSKAIMRNCGSGQFDSYRVAVLAGFSEALHRQSCALHESFMSLFSLHA